MLPSVRPALEANAQAQRDSFSPVRVCATQRLNEWVFCSPTEFSFWRVKRLMIEILAVALGVGVAVGVGAIVVDSWRRRVPPLADWQKSTDLLVGPAAETAERARELARRETSLAQRERLVEQAMADAQRRFAEATARMEALERVLATREGDLQQRESELADRQRSLAERELSTTERVSRAEGRRSTGSDWWDKQLGDSRPPKET